MNPQPPPVPPPIHRPVIQQWSQPQRQPEDKGKKVVVGAAVGFLVGAVGGFAFAAVMRGGIDGIFIWGPIPAALTIGLFAGAPAVVCAALAAAIVYVAL